jgi:hypothetical protein
LFCELTVTRPLHEPRDLRSFYIPAPGQIDAVNPTTLAVAPAGYVGKAGVLKELVEGKEAIAYVIAFHGQLERVSTRRAQEFVSLHVLIMAKHRAVQPLLP